MSIYRDSRDIATGIARPTGHYHLPGSSPCKGLPGGVVVVMDLSGQMV